MSQGPNPGLVVSQKDFEKLRRKMWTMKHRVCLLEFGLGSVARLVRDVGEGEPSSLNQEAEGQPKLDDQFKYKRTLEGINDVLKDVEDSMILAYSPDFKEFEKTSVDAPVRCEISPQKALENTPHNGINSPTSDFCSIQLVANPCEYQSLTSMDTNRHFSANSNESNLEMNGSRCAAQLMLSTNSLDALSTLAVVASSKLHEKPGLTRGGPQVDNVSCEGHDSVKFHVPVRRTPRRARRTLDTYCKEFP